MWWLWPHFKRLWAMAATVVAGLTINYLYGLWGEQSVPSVQQLARFLWGSWYWAGGALSLFAIVSIFAARAHRRHEAPHFIGAASGRRARKGAKRPPLPAPATAASLMVGREDEIAQLREWFASVLKGERRVVFLSGEAGIGKTTFVRAFLDSLGNDGAVRIARGQCVEQYGAGEPYMPMLEALTQLGRGAEGPHLLALLHRLAPAWLAQLPALLTAEERARIQGETQGLTQQRMLREMAETLAAIATDAPLVILLEDLHWSDASTLDLIAALARRTEPARLLVIGTYRPVEMLAGDHPLRALKQELELHGHCHELRLKLLSEEHVAAYLGLRFANNGAAQLSGLAPAVYQRSEGNPLFMVNVADYLKAQGPRLDASKIETPRNIRQMIERNLERLTADEQSVLESASVAGAEFSAAAVVAALERPVSEIEACCTRLSRHEQFIRSQGATEWPDGTLATGYRFLHALYQEVLYERTPVGSRAALHARIAAREEAAWGAGAAEIAAELAYHYGRCGDKPKALKYLALAGERAVARGALVEGEQHYREAIAFLQALPESRERDTREMALQVALGGVMQGTRGFSAGATAQAYARAKVLAERVGEAESLQVIGGLHAAALTQGNLRPALALGEQMLEIARGIGDASALAKAHGALGLAHFLLGDLDRARKDFLEATEDYGEQDFIGAIPWDPGVHALLWAAINQWYLGHPDQARRYADNARSLARRQNNPYSLALALGGVGTVFGQCGDFTRALKAHDETVRLAIELGFPTRKAFGTIHGAWARARLGEIGVAVEQIQEGLRELDDVRFQAFRASVLSALSETQALAGRVDDAFVTVEQALQTNPDELIYRPNLLRLRGELRLRSVGGSKAQFELAEQDFREAIDLARSMGAKSLELRATTSLARLLAKQGRRDEARTMLAEIYNWFTEGFDTRDLKEAKALLETLNP